MGNLSVSALPREQILAFGHVCQDNLMYILQKAYYIELSWTQNMFYKAASPFIDPETRAKMLLTTERTVPELKEIFHPC
jgi:hypothetical protein